MYEIWRAIPEYPKYLVSNYGRVCRDKILKIDYTRNGYGTVTLNDCPRKKLHKMVHMLVLMCFFPNPNPDLYDRIDHINRNIRDNRLCNLRWSNAQLNQLNSNARGFYYDKIKNKFRAVIVIDGKNLYLGSFKYSVNARKAYLRAKSQLLKYLDPNQKYEI